MKRIICWLTGCKPLRVGPPKTWWTCRRCERPVPHWQRSYPPWDV